MPAMVRHFTIISVYLPPGRSPQIGGAAHARVQGPRRGASECERHVVLHSPSLLLDLLFPLLGLLEHGLLALPVGVLDGSAPLGHLVQLVLLPEAHLLQVTPALHLLLFTEFLCRQGLKNI